MNAHTKQSSDLVLSNDIVLFWGQYINKEDKRQIKMFMWGLMLYSWATEEGSFSQDGAEQHLLSLIRCNRCDFKGEKKETPRLFAISE